MVKFRFFDPDEKPKDASAPVAEPISTEEHSPAPASPQELTLKLPQTDAAKDAPVVRTAGLTLEWTASFGWHRNPFTASALPAHKFIVNQDHARSMVNLFFIKEHSFGTISSDRGMGKTFMLRWLFEELQPYADRFAIFGFDASIFPDDFAKKLAEPYHGLFHIYKGRSPGELSEYLSRRCKKRLVVLLDNADNLGGLEPYLRYLLEVNKAIIIFAGVTPHPLAQDQLQVKLQTLTPHDAVKLVEKRIAGAGGTGVRPFNPHLLEELFKAAKHQPALFLHYCDDTAMKVALRQLSIDEPETHASSAENGPGESKPATAKPAAKKEAPPSKPKNPKNPYDDLIAEIAK